jgi:phosphoserine aminotransferase
MRVYNFNPGPSTLPLPVLEKVRSELLDYKGTGMSVMEMSHRSPEFEAIVHNAEALFKELAGVGDDYRVLFIQGGASLQFDMIPLNFLPSGKTADYVLTGSFAEKAYQEAQKIGVAQIAASSQDDQYKHIPAGDKLALNKDAAYVHITTNNTIYGTQWHYLPETDGVPLIADMSSDILSRPLNYNKMALVYAGAQKNLGPSGIAVVMIRKDLLEQIPKDLPSMLRYDIYAKNDSLYNTPPSFAIYMIELVLQWIKDMGGITAMGKHNEEKAALIYNAIDQSQGFYQGHAREGSRSQMNITYRLPSEDLETKFAQEAKAVGLVGLKGHRSVGGMRASVYNAMSILGCETLATFMEDFQLRNQ